MRRCNRRLYAQTDVTTLFLRSSSSRCFFANVVSVQAVGAAWFERDGVLKCGGCKFWHSGGDGVMILALGQVTDSNESRL